MARLLDLTPEDAAFDRDPTFRREFVDNILEAAQAQGVFIDTRCRHLFEQYADGEISCVELHHEIGRPLLH